MSNIKENLAYYNDKSTLCLIERLNFNILIITTLLWKYLLFRGNNIVLDQINYTKFVNMV